MVRANVLWLASLAIAPAMAQDTVADDARKIAAAAERWLASDQVDTELLDATVKMLSAHPQLAVDWRGGDHFRFQAEAALTYLTLGRSDVKAATVTEKTVISGGVGVRASLRDGRHEGRVDAGYASGEDEGGFGVLDTDNFRKEDGSPRSTLTGFHFHRDYRVDGLLFRDLVGAVANTFYLRPAWRLHLLEGTDGSDLHVELGVLGALAASSSATPGKGSVLGWEPAASLLLKDGPVEAAAGATLLLPGDAFDSPGGVAAQPAFRLEALLRLSF